MTPTKTRQDGRRSGRARVTDVSVLVLAHPEGRTLDTLLAALAAQALPPQRILICGLDPQGQEAAEALEHPDLRERRIPVIVRGTPPAGDGRGERSTSGPEPQAPPQWRVVEDARAALPVHEDNWLWILHDDSLPAPGALAALTAAVRRSSRVAMVGPKLVRDDDPRLLVGVGHQLTVAGRPGDPAQSALVDQGQLDLRQDVLAVPLAGALVRSDLFDAVGGIDKAFGADGVDGLDLGWRLQLAGHRVVVAPDAVVRQGEEGLGVVDPRRTRVRTRQVALARGSFLAGLPRAAGVAITSALAALLLLLVKRPTEAADEWADVRAAVAPWRGWGARWRFRGRRAVRPGDLRGLFLRPGTGLRSTLDTAGAALDPRARRDSAERDRRGGEGAPESGPVADELAGLGPGRTRSRRWSWPLATALLLALALTGWQWRGLLGALRPGGTGVSGGELGPAATDAVGLWRSALDPWRGGGLGHDGAAEPWLVPASVLTRLVELLPGSDASHFTAGVALGWLLLLAVPASVLTAYLALRRATRRGWVRAGLALAYAGLLPLGAAVGQGRVGPVVVHVLAPLLVAGYAVSSARAGGPRRAAAAFATVLGLVLAAQWVPSMLVLATVGGLALLLAGRGQARWRGMVLALLPWALMLPWLPSLWHDPLRILGGAGATFAAPSDAEGLVAPAWAGALLHPAGPPDLGTPDSWALWAMVPFWLAALGAVALPGRPGRRAAVLLGVALATLAGAVLLGRLRIGALPEGHAQAGQVVSAWPGTMLSVVGAALLLASALLLEHLLSTVDRYRTTTSAEAPRAAGTVIVTATVLAVALPVTGLALVTWQAVTDRPTGLAAVHDPLPAVAAEQARGPSALRTLVLRPGVGEGLGGEPSTVLADLVGAEPEPARILRDRVDELDVMRAADAGASEVADLAVAITGGQSGDEVRALLQRLGVGFVHVLAPEETALVEQIDRVPDLTRVSSPDDQVLWRLSGEHPARVQILDGDGTVFDRVDVTGPHAAASGTVDDAPPGARLHVAEGSGWADQARATIDGAPAEVADDGSIALPGGDRTVTIAQRTPSFPLHLVAMLLALITIFLALPFGRVETEPDR
ncbi:glycosyltransferase [Ornithinimicrobium panacihumi]|uniref:glycosyltransferase n=1 Tax=Ornithinimicrobium panacihumi TaxID=2008449 RepID=UPI003F8A943D